HQNGYPGERHDAVRPTPIRPAMCLQRRTFDQRWSVMIAQFYLSCFKVVRRTVARGTNLFEQRSTFSSRLGLVFGSETASECEIGVYSSCSIPAFALERHQRA